MTRTSIQQAIDFQGLIEGCPDHQWLLTDALYHSGEEPSADNAPRWVIRSELVESPTSDAGRLRNHFVAFDREAGWTLSAPSASALAQRIQRQCDDASSHIS